MTWNGGQALPPGIGRWPSSSITKVAAGWHLAGVNGGDRDGPNEDRLTRQEVEVLLERMLRHQAGVDPSHLGQVLDLAAVSIVNSAWRNSPVADCYAGDGPLTDGDILRIKLTPRVCGRSCDAGGRGSAWRRIRRPPHLAISTWTRQIFWPCGSGAGW